MLSTLMIFLILAFNLSAQRYGMVGIWLMVTDVKFVNESAYYIYPNDKHLLAVEFWNPVLNPQKEDFSIIDENGRILEIYTIQEIEILDDIVPLQRGILWGLEITVIHPKTRIFLTYQNQQVSYYLGFTGSYFVGGSQCIAPITVRDSIKVYQINRHENYISNYEYNRNSSVLLVEWSVPVLPNIEKFTVTSMEDGSTLELFDLKEMRSWGDITDLPERTVWALTTSRLNYKTHYIINYCGHISYYYHNGFAPNLIGKPLN